MPIGELSWLGRVWGGLHLELGLAAPLPSFHTLFFLLARGKAREILKECRRFKNIK